MAKKRQENQPSETAKQAAQPRKAKRPTTDLPWHPVWRALVSLLVVLHLLAVFSAPWDLATGPAEPPGYEPPTDSLGRPTLPPPEIYQQPIVTRPLRGFFNHYLNLLYLNHGYEFFAPDPAGVHVIDYRVTKPDGSVVEGRFPDHSAQWPRLLYHRHMMLADQSMMVDGQVAGLAQATGKRIPFSGDMYASHLATIHGGQASLDMKIHLLLSQQRVLDGTEINDPSTYRKLGTANGSPRAPRGESESASPGNEAPIAIPGGGQ